MATARASGTIVGSPTRVIAHPSNGGGVSPAGIVASFYVVCQA